MDEIQKNVAIAQAFNIESFVKEATWKDILIELVEKNKLDPWDINLVDLVEKYLEVVKQVKVLDLRIPANIILAASILLRLKSEMLDVEEQVPEPEEMAYERSAVQVGELIPRLKLPKKSRVTLSELISALDEAMKLKEEKEAMYASKPAPIPIIIDRVDVEASANELYKELGSCADSKHMLTLKYLISRLPQKDALLDIFVPLLFLANHNRVLLIQEKFFGEIIIAIDV